MLDALKNLFENNVISEEIKESIEAAWEARIVENRTQVTQQLREEFAQRYEHDKSVMIEAIDRMLGDQLKEEIQQFVEDRNQLAEAKAKYAVKMHNDARLMKEFVTRQLASEVKELHEDQVQMASKFHTLEKFVVEALAQEIAEFHVDKQDIAETKVRLVREGREALAQMKEKFIKRAAQLVESTVEKTLSKEIGQLKEDIEAARRNDFGRKLFEAFASEYQGSYLSEKSESAKLLKVIDLKELELAAAKNAVAEAKLIAESKEAEINALMESKARQEIMNELVAPLANTQKAIMTELLESVHTAKLKNSFEKYLPAVIAGAAPQKKKQALVEAKEVTGNKETHSVSSSEHESNIFDMRRLAGLKH
jgi:ATP-dependent Clp protease adapter protein ClpS